MEVQRTDLLAAGAKEQCVPGSQFTMCTLEAFLASLGVQGDIAQAVLEQGKRRQAEEAARAEEAAAAAAAAAAPPPQSMELDGTPRAASDGAQSSAYTVDWEKLQKSLGEHLEAAGVTKQQAADAAKAAVLLNTKRPPG
eukprot:7031075-Lingulodinium_polyedra.AAC.1